MNSKNVVSDKQQHANPQQVASNLQFKRQQRKYVLDSIQQQDFDIRKNYDSGYRNCEQKQLNSSNNGQKITINNIAQLHMYEQLQKILNFKIFEQRITQQNLLLTQFADNNPYLKFLAEQFGNQFIKGILRSAKLLRVQKDKVLVEQGQPNLYSFLILQGKLGLTIKKIRNQIQTKNISTPSLWSIPLSLQETLEKIVQISRAESKSIVKTMRIQLYGNSQTYDTISSMKSGINTPALGTIEWDHHKDGLNQVGQQNWTQKLSKGSQFGLKPRCYGKNYLNTAICLQDCILLQINIIHFMHWLNLAMAQKLKKQRVLLRNIPCFKKIPDEKLQNLVYLLAAKKSKRNDFIYKQGENSTHFFILMQGQIKLNKDTHLFVQNPNTFYINRNQLVTPPNKIKGISSKNKPLLPYAQLSNMYNYHPKNKIIEIGVISPVCLFGEEEMIQGRNRQTNAICVSQTVCYFQINYRKLQQTLGKQLMPQFLQQVKLYSKKKVLNRQDRYANNVQLENQKNLNYFYYDGQKQINAPRKFNLLKINQRIQPKLSAFLNQNVIKSQQFPPQYTTFNFHKMKSKQKYGKLEKINFSQIKEKQRKLKIRNKNSSKLSKQDTDSQTEQVQKLMNLNQLKIVENAHTWRPIKTQVKREMQISRKISPVRPSISLKSPLFDPKYFKDAYIRNKRIQKQFRTKKLSLGNKSNRKLLEHQ